MAYGRQQQLSGGRFSRGTRQQQRAETTMQPACRQVHNAAGAIPANSLPRLRRPAGSRCGKQHERCVNIAHVNIVTLRYTNPGPSAKREIQGRVSGGGAASRLLWMQRCSCNGSGNWVTVSESFVESPPARNATSARYRIAAGGLCRMLSYSPSLA